MIKAPSMPKFKKPTFGFGSKKKQPTLKREGASKNLTVKGGGRRRRRTKKRKRRRKRTKKKRKRRRTKKKRRRRK